jgi:hypothetical protein
VVAGVVLVVEDAATLIPMAFVDRGRVDLIMDGPLAAAQDKAVLTDLPTEHP